MVPLTGSIYVPGTITDTENVIIDIGTGYYAEKVRLLFIVYLQDRKLSKLSAFDNLTKPTTKTVHLT